MILQFHAARPGTSLAADVIDWRKLISGLLINANSSTINVILVNGKPDKLMEIDRFNQKYLPLGQLEPPPAGNVDLWFLNLWELGSPLMLSDQTVEQATLRPRHERTIRRFYLRLLLGAYLGISGKDVVISRLVKGKPVLDEKAHPNRLEFSSASSGGHCLIGIASAGQIGVDLEQAGRETGSPMALVRRYFSVDEQEQFASLPESAIQRAFMHAWACKEAVVKAAGHGIANQLYRFTVNADPDQPPAMLSIDHGHASDWQLAMVKPAEKFVGSVALKHPQLRINAFSLSRRPGS